MNIYSENTNKNKVMNKNSNPEKESTLESRERIIYIYTFITSMLIIITNYIFYNLTKLPDNFYTPSVILTFILPFILNIYSSWWHVIFGQTHTQEEFLKELQYLNSLEQDSKMPVILFGLGIFVIKLGKNITKYVLIYLVGALLFGTLVPEVLNHFIFDITDIERLLVIEEIQFSLIILSYGFLLMGIYITCYYYINGN
jgi:hypothetical protein